MSINNEFYQSSLSQMNDFDVQSDWKKESLLGREIWQIKKSNDSNIIKIHHIKLSAFQNFIKFISDLFSLNWDVKVNVSTKNIELERKIDHLTIEVLREVISQADLTTIEDSLLKNYQSTCKIDTVSREILSPPSSKNDKVHNIQEDEEKKSVIDLTEKIGLEILKKTEERKGSGDLEQLKNLENEEEVSLKQDNQKSKKIIKDPSLTTEKVIPYTYRFFSSGIAFFSFFYSQKFLANKGDVRAQVNLGNWYRQGLGVEQDYQKAMKYYELAANQGDTAAHHNIGYLYSQGLGVEQDYQKAMKYYQLAADQGYAYAQVNLGNWYRQGLGVEQDYQEAMKYYQLAAEQGDVDAQFKIGYMYDEGHGVDQDYQTALKHYQLAAVQGSARAQNNIGNMYYEGHGVEQDYQEAMRYYQLAAEQGNAGAQFNIGYMYEKGHGVEQDYQKAMKYYQLAAEQGVLKA